VSDTFGVADMLREPDAITFALTEGAFNNFLAAIAWYILEKYERRPFGDLSDMKFSVGTIDNTGEVVITFEKNKEKT
jgi:hypothetical protein